MRTYIIDNPADPRTGPLLASQLIGRGFDPVIHPDWCDGSAPPMKVHRDRFRKLKCYNPRKGEIGCFGSHVNICKAFVAGEIVESFEGGILVLEDDAIPEGLLTPQNIDLIVRSSARYPLVNLDPDIWILTGVQGGGPWRYRRASMDFSGTLVKTSEHRWFFRTHAMIYFREAAERIAGAEMELPFDDFLAHTFLGRYGAVRPGTVFGRPAVGQFQARAIGKEPKERS